MSNVVQFPEERQQPRAKFVLPGAADRTIVIAQTGGGKTVLGAWILSKQRFDKRPWVALDFKNEELWDLVGDPPMRPLKLGRMPGKRGLYRMDVNPGQEDALEEWLWKVWRRGNIGLFADEVTLIPRAKAFRAILRQGRSRLIPVIACTQRPVEVDREVFSESRFKIVLNLDDTRDYKTVREFIPRIPIDRPLPPYHSYWYDSKTKSLFVLQPVPKPSILATDLRERLPYNYWLGA